MPDENVSWHPMMLMIMIICNLTLQSTGQQTFRFLCTFYMFYSPVPLPCLQLRSFFSLSISTKNDLRWPTMPHLHMYMYLPGCRLHMHQHAHETACFSNPSFLEYYKVRESVDCVIDCPKSFSPKLTWCCTCSKGGGTKAQSTNICH